MTEQTDSDQPDEQPDQPDERPGPQHGDPDLAALVQLANAFGLEQELVLTLPGQVLAGTLVGGRSHFAELADAVQGQDPDETMRGALAASLRKRSADFDAWGAGSKLGALDPDGPDGADLAPMPPVDFLHLRNVAVVTWPASGQRLATWRGRLSDVVGWTVGGFEDVPAD
ncbi:MAG: hypothetical protein ABI776_05335 [Nocardioidaceae bacterium]